MSETATAPTLLCRKCDQHLPESAYYPSIWLGSGAKGTCKQCLKDHLDRNKARQNVKNWYERHPEAVQAKNDKVRRKREDERNADPVGYARALFDSTVRRKYGITIEQWEDRFETQGRRCRCCRRAESGFANRGGLYPGWHTDHDHVTGEVRGILCGHCNLGLGHFFDDANQIENAVHYLRPFETGVDEHY